MHFAPDHRGWLIAVLSWVFVSSAALADAPSTQPSSAAAPADSVATADAAEVAATQRATLSRLQQMRASQGAAPVQARAAAAAPDAPAPDVEVLAAADDPQEEMRERIRQRLEEMRRERQERAREQEQEREQGDEEEAQPTRTSPLPARRPTPSRPTPTQREATTRTPVISTDATVVLESPATQPSEATGGMNWFQYSDVAWEDVVRDFARRLGKPLMDADVVIGGTLTYLSDRTDWTEQEAIDELNFLLYEKDFHFVEQRDRIRILSMMEMPAYIPVERNYATYEAFKEANLRPMDYAVVFVKVEGQDASAINDAVAPGVSPQLLSNVVEDTNQIKLSGVAADIERYVGLMQRVNLTPDDPRVLRIIRTKSNVNTIRDMLNQLFDTQQQRRRFNPQTRRWEVGGDGGPSLQITADERINSLIVRGLPDEVNEIEELLEQIDREFDLGEFKTRVIEIVHANANEVASLLNKIFAQEQGQSSGGGGAVSARNAAIARARALAAQRARQRAARRGQAVPAQPNATVNVGSADPTEILGEDVLERARKTIRIVSFDRTNSIAVYANEEGHERVREMLEQIDVPQPTNLQRIALENVEVSEVIETIRTLADDLAGQGRGRGATIVPDEAGNGIYVMADADIMQGVRDIVAELDTPSEARQRYVVELQHVTPDEMVGLINSLVLSESTPRRSSRFDRRFRGRRPTTPAGGNDRIQMSVLGDRTLIVVCSADDWVEVEQIIQLADTAAVTSVPELKTYDIVHADANEITRVLGQFYRRYERAPFPPSEVLIDAQDGKIFVQAIAPAHEEIGALIASLDQPSADDEPVIVPLACADANEIANQVNGLFGSASGRRSSRGRFRGGAGGDGPTVQPEPVTNALIVQAEPADMERILKFVQDVDQRICGQQPETRFFTLRYANPNEVASSINQMFNSGAGGGRGRSRFGGQPTGLQVSAMAAGRQLIVEAPSGKFSEIENFVAQLDDPRGERITIETLKLPGADVQNIARNLTRAFSAMSRQRGLTAAFEADSTNETIVLTISEELMAEARELIDQYVEASAGQITQVEFIPMKHAEATEAQRWLSEQLIAAMTKQYGRNARQMIKVTADPRTNRVIINAPTEAVERGKVLLAQFDQPGDSQPELPMRTETYKLAGLDVGALTRTLDQTFRNRRRTDRLRASFSSDQITEILVVSAPNDMYEEIDRIIETFKSEAMDVTPEQVFVQVQNSEANYIADQLRKQLQIQIRAERGRAVADRINIGVDPRLNRIILNAPKFVLPRAQALVEELDQAPTVEGDRIRTIPLLNADANVVSGVLRTVLREQMRQQRTLSIDVEPLTNSLIVSADKATYDMIEEWAKTLDENAAGASNDPQIFELNNANPWEVRNVLNQTFIPRGYGRRQQPGKEISFAVIAGTSIVAQAPQEKMAEIAKLIAELDALTAKAVEVRTYELPGIGDRIRDFGRQVEQAVNKKLQGQAAREQAVSVSTYPDIDTLVFTALPDQFVEIEKMMEKFKGVFEGDTLVTEFIKLVHLNAAEAANAVEEMIANRLATVQRRGRRSTQNLNVLGDPRTNRLIVTAPEKVMPEVRELLTQLDVPQETNLGQMRTVGLAAVDAQQVAQTLQPIYNELNREKRDDVSFVPVKITPEPITNSLLVIAGDQEFEAIKVEATRIDEAVVASDVKPRRFKLENIEAEEVVRLVQELFPAPQRRGRGYSTSITEQVTVVAAGDDVIVKAPPQKMTQIEDFIQSADVDTPFPYTIRAFDVTPMDAGQLAVQVNAALIGMFGTRGGIQPAAFAEPASNQLIVMAPEESLPFVQGLLTQVRKEIPEAFPQSYELNFARAQQVISTVDTMLKAKALEQKGMGGSRPEMPVSVEADDRTNTLVVFGPPLIQEAAREVIALLDIDKPSGEIMKIVQVEEADARELATTLKQVISGQGESNDRNQNRFRPWWAEPADSEDSDDALQRVTIVADETSNSLVLKGLPQDVQEVENLIADLVEAGSRLPEIQRYQIRFVNADRMKTLLDSVLSATPSARDVAVEVDEARNELFVTAPERQQELVARYVKQFDEQPDAGDLLKRPDGRQIYFVDTVRDAWDISWEVEDLLPAEGGPELDPDWDGRYIKVVARPDELPIVEQLIRQVESRMRPENTIVQVQPRGDYQRILQQLQQQYPDVQVQSPTQPDGQDDSLIIDVWKEGEKPPVKRRKERERAAREAERAPHAQRTRVLPMLVAAQGYLNARDEVLRELEGRPATDPNAATPRPAAALSTIEAPQREKVEIVAMPDGRLIITGPEDQVEEIQDTLDKLEEDLRFGEVIRVFRFRYGDVNSAAQIIETMFNDPQPQRAARPQPRQNQQNQQGQRGGSNNQDGDDDQATIERLRQQLQEEQQQAAGGRSGGGTRVRIATDPSRNYLIVKCDESDLPEILQLARILDDEPEVEVDVRIFQLRTLDAETTAANIREVLGIDSGRGAQRTPTRGARGGRQQQQLTSMLEEQLVSIGGESAKIEATKVVPNTLTNSIMVSAPAEVMQIVSTVLDDLAALEARGVAQVVHYELTEAKVDDILPLLEVIFAGTQQYSAENPAQIGPVTVTGDPRNNTIIFVAQTKDIDNVQQQIAQLDIPGEVSNAETYVCQYGDATAIAAAVEAVFDTQSARSGGGRRGPESASVSQAVRVVPEPSTNAIVVWGPKERRDDILEQIRAFDERSRREFREIAVIHADPERLAETLTQMFGGLAATASGAEGRGGNRRGGQSSATGGNVVIVGDKNAKKLLVRAPDALYLQIEDTVGVLDQPDELLQIRRFQLTHTDPMAVKSRLDQAIAEYVQVATLTGDSTDFDPFTVVPDSRTNSVLIVGSERVFLFVQAVLAEWDRATPAEFEPVWRVIGVPRSYDIGQLAASAQEALAATEAMFSEQQSRPPQPVSITAEERSHALIVAGDPRMVSKVAGLVDDILEEGGKTGTTTIVIDTGNLSAQEALRVIQEVQQQTGGGGASRPRGVNRRSGTNDRNRSSLRRGGRRGTWITPAEADESAVQRGVPRDRAPRMTQPFVASLVLTPLLSLQLIDNVAGAVEDERPGARAGLREPVEATRLGHDPVADSLSSVRLGGQVRQPQTYGGRAIVMSDLPPSTLITPSDATNDVPSTPIGSPVAAETRQSHAVAPFPRDAVGRPIAIETPSGRTPVESRPHAAVTETSSRERVDWTALADAVRRNASTTLATVADATLAAAHQFSVEFERAIDALGGAVAHAWPHEAPDRFVLQGPTRDVVVVAAHLAPRAQELVLVSASDSPSAPKERKPTPSRITRVWRPGSAQLVAADQDPNQSPDPIEALRELTRRRAAEEARSAESTDDRRGSQRRTRVVRPAPAQAAEGGRRAAPDTANAAPGAANPAPTGSLDVSGELRGDVTAVELSPSKVLVQGDEADVAFLQRLLQELSAVAPQTDIEVFKLEVAKASALAPLIEEIVQASIDARGLDETFSITAEPRSNSLIVAATVDVLDEVAGIVQRLDDTSIEIGEGVQTKRITLEHVRASEAAAQLRPIIQQLNAKREVPEEAQATISAIDRANSIIVIGTTRDIEEITELIAALDIPLEAEGERIGVFSEMQIVTLQNGRAVDVAEVLTSMIEAEQTAAREAASAGEAVGVPAVRKLQLVTADGDELPPIDLEKPIRLIPESGTNSIIVFSTKANNDALVQVIDVFDTLPLGAETEVRAFVLQYATAEAVAGVLEEVFEEGREVLSRPSEQQIDEGELPPMPRSITGAGLPFRVSVSFDARSNTVVVVGREESIKLASGLVQEMDRPGAQLGLDSYVLGPLRSTQAVDLEERLTEVLDERAEALGDGAERDVAVVKADPRSNSLIVVANPDVYGLVRDLVNKLDTAESYRVVDTVYQQLAYADAAKLQDILTQVFEAKDSARTETETQTSDFFSVLADPRSNSLILTGTEDYLLEANELVEELDRRFDPTVVFEIVNVQFNSARNVAALLSEVIEQTQSQSDGALTGTPIHIAADPISDSILLAASAEDIEPLKKWINELDRPSEIGRMVRIIPLERALAEDLAESVQELFEQTGDEGELNVVVRHDAFTNSIIATGPPGVLSDIEEVVQRLDRTESLSGAIIRIFELEQADAEEATELLQNILEGRGGAVGAGAGGGGSTADALKQVMLLYQQNPSDGRTLRAMREDITVVGNVRTNALVVIAPPDSMPLMESLITAIDLPPEAARIRVFPLRNSDAGQMVELLNDLFESETTATTGEGEEERELTIEGGATSGRQDVSFAADVRTNSVIAAGTPGYLDLVEELVLSLDAQDIPERKTLVYAPRNNPVEAIADAISQWSDAEQERLDDIGDDVSALRRAQAEVIAIASEDSNRLLINVDPRYEAEVLDIVSGLDQPPPQVSIEVLIIELQMETTLELGIEFAAQDLEFTAAGPDDTTTFDYVYGTDLGASGAGLGGFSFTIAGRDFNFLLRTLQTETNLRVLSRPHIVATDKQPATVEVTNDVPYVSATSTTDAGQITTSVARQDIGIILEVEPQINPDGFVRLIITQEISDITDSTVTIQPGVNSPIFLRRRAETVVTVRDSETIVLGGLIQQREERSENKVPIIGDLPVVGSLFRYDNDNTRRNELLIVLTPRIIRTVDDFREESLLQRDSSQLGDEVLINPLMRGLQLPPEQIVPPEYREELGPYELRRYRDETDDDRNDFRRQDEYGPLGDLEPLREELRGGDSASYDLPLSQADAGGASAVSNRRRR